LTPLIPGSPFSPVRFADEILQNTGIFAYFAAKGGAVSLRFRLAGGEVGIRTLGTGLNGVRADVCVSYRESIFYPEIEGLMPLRRWGKPVQFPVQSKGEWLAILRLKVVSTTPLKRPDCFAPDCVRAAQSKSEKYLRRMGSSKANGWRFSESLAHALDVPQGIGPSECDFSRLG
jgi:hypothetical protein